MTASRSSSTTSAPPTSAAARSTTWTASWGPASRSTTRTRCTRALAATLSTPATTPAAHKPAAAATNQRSRRRIREYVLLTLGVLTPLGILAVNASAFVMMHLDAFRIVIAGLALLSGLVLNGLTAWWLLRLASLQAPPLFREYRTWAIGAAVLVVALTAAGGGYLTYLGMRDPKHLPDSLSIIAAAFALLLPFALTFAGRRMAGLGGIIPVDEPSGKTKSPSRRGAHLSRTN